MSEELPDPPDGGDDGADTEATEEEEDLGERDAELFGNQERADLREANDSLEQIEMDEYHNEDLVQAQQHAPVNAGIAIAAGGPPPGLDGDVDEAMERIRQQPDDRQQWNTQRYIALFSGLGGIAGVVAALYEIIHNAISGESDADNPLPAEIRAKVRSLVQKWWSRTDTAYWNDLAIAADDETLALTLEDQILFMNYTIDLSPITPWIWRSSADIQAVVNQLRTAYATAGSKTSAMYRLAPTIRYEDPMTQQDIALPRAVAATVLRYALSYILVNPTVPPTADRDSPGDVVG